MGASANTITAQPLHLGTWLQALAVAAACSACTDLPARAPVDDAALLAHLGFIQGDRVERRLVEARLGEPTARYEGGRVVSYAVYLSKGRLQLRPGGRCFGLMIAYGADEVIARQALVREGSVHCPRA